MPYLVLTTNIEIFMQELKLVISISAVTRYQKPVFDFVTNYAA